MGSKHICFLFLLGFFFWFFPLRFLPTQKANTIKYLIKKRKIFKEMIVKRETFVENADMPDVKIYIRLKVYCLRKAELNVTCTWD